MNDFYSERVFEEFLNNQALEDDPKVQFYSLDELKILWDRHFIENPITDLSTAIELYNESNTRLWAIDTETTGFDHWKDFINGVGFSDGINHIYLGTKDAIELTRYMDFTGVTWFLHNTKFDRNFLKKYGVTLTNTFDTMIMAYLLGYSTKLSTLAKQFLQRNPYEFNELKNLPPDMLGKYCAEDCFETIELGKRFLTTIKTQNLTELFEIDNKFERVLAYMEYIGTFVDVIKLHDLKVQYESKLCTLKSLIVMKSNEIMGKEVNPNSSKQLQELFYIHLNLPQDGIKQCKNGLGSTDAQSLDLLRFYHDIPKWVYEHRLYTKALEFVNKLLKYQHEGIVRTNYGQTVTSTGRLSSSKPNLQNIPARGNIGKDLRSVFIGGDPADTKKCFAIDYSQFELRILAQTTNDEKLMDAYRNDVDIHTLVTELIFDIVYDSENPEHIALRRFCKTLNFGIIYGMSHYKLAAMAKVSLEEALELMERHKLIFGSVWDWFNLNKCLAMINGYTVSLVGRRRFYNFSNKVTQFSLTNSSLATKSPTAFLARVEKYMTAKDYALLRQANNHPIQGTNADLMRIVMNNIYSELIDDKWKGKLHMHLQIHDELFFSYSSKYKFEQCLQDVKKQMILYPKIYLPDVPIRISTGIGKNWLLCK